MRYVKAGDAYLVRLDTDEEIWSGIERFAADQKVDLGVVSGIGSVYDIVLGFYDRAAGDYVRRTIAEEMEIVSLLGNISLKEGRAFPHLHVTLGTRDYRALAGHLFEGKVAATCEVVIRPLPGLVHRRRDEKLGLYLWDV